MVDADLGAARARIEHVEKRIAALQDAGLDVAALRAQLAFAHSALREGRLADVEAICDEVQGAARRLAELGQRGSVRTPAHGTPALPPRDPSTEEIRRVKVSRAQLADEVRAAIDEEVRNQIAARPAAGSAAPVATAAVDGRLARIEERLDAIAEQAAAPAVPLTRILARLESLEQRPAAAPAAGPDPRVEALAAEVAKLAAAPVPAPAADPRIDALVSEVARLAAAPAATPAAAIEIPPVMAERLAALERRTAGLDSLAAGLARIEAHLAALPPAAAASAPADLETQVQRAVEVAMPRQAAELMREAVAKLPTRDDLHQIAETLRSDLDWRLEKAAAEHGWCSLHDVETTVRKLVADVPQPQVGGSQLGRLEIALAEFVQQSKDQQERLIAALADRVAQQTKRLTKSVIRPDPAPVPAAGGSPAAAPVGESRDTEELAPSISNRPGEGSSRLAAITGALQRPSPAAMLEVALDPLPQQQMEAARATHGGTTLVTKRTAANQPDAEPDARPDTEPEDLHALVSAEVERALSGAVASTMTTPAEQAAVATVLPAAASPSAPPADLAVLIAAEVGRQLAVTVPVQLPPSDADLARAVARALPQALQDETVRSELFAVLALECTAKPGVVAELTGLRRFLRRELDALAHAHQGA